MFLRAFFLTLLLYSSIELKAQKDWELIKNRDGIKVYRKNSDSSAFKSVMVECVLEGTWEKLANIVKDVTNHHKWVYKSVEAKLLKAPNQSDLTYYTVTEIPWPFENRDVIINMKFNEDKSGKSYSIITNSEPDEMPKRPGMVRVPYFRALWKVKPLDKNTLSITYIVSVNPGGSLPPWLVNSFAVKGPFETFRKLADLLKN